MNRLLLLLLVATAIYSCGDKTKKPTEPTTTTDPDTANTYMPITDLLHDDIRKVDSFAAGILRKANFNGKKDSAFVHLPDFHIAAQQFFLEELDSAYFRDSFEETALMDESTRMVNFIYTPENPSEPVRKVVVYVSPSLADDTIDRLYIEAGYTRGDTTIEKKLTWKMKKYFYVLTIKQPKEGKPVTTMEKLIWDPQHFGDE